MKNKLLLYVILPSFIFGICLISVVYGVTRREGLFNLLHDHQQKQILNAKNLIEKDMEITGFITAQYPNFGSVSIRFNTMNRMNTDWLIFRIREAGQTDWYYEQKYKVDQFQPDRFFPFGFPIISDSKNKNYEISLTSISGEIDNSVAVSEIEPQIRTKYLIDRGDLLRNYEILKPWLLAIRLKIYSEPWAILALAVCAWNLFVYQLFLWIWRNRKSVEITFLRGKYELNFTQLVILGIVGTTVIHSLLNLRLDNLLIIYILFLSIGAYVLSSYKIEVLGYLSLYMLVLSIFWFIVGIYEQTDVFFVWIYLWAILGLFLCSIRIRIKLIPPQLRFKTIEINKKNVLSVLDKYNKFVRAFLLLIIVWLIRELAYKWYYVWGFYQDYFIDNQSSEFWVDYQNTFWQYLLFIFAGNTIIWIFRKRKTIIFETSILILILFTVDANNSISSNLIPLQENVKIWQILPNRITLWDEIVINGRNFGDIPYQGKVFINGDSHRIIKWTNKQIVVQAEPGKTKSGELLVETYQGKKDKFNIEVYDYFTGEKV